MTTLRDWADNVSEELDGAEHYARLAAEMKATHPEGASTFHEMAEQEMEHACTLCKAAEKHIAVLKDDMTPAERETVWKWEKARVEDRKAKIKAMLNV